MDRPTNQTLQYLTRVKPHRIVKDPFLVDPYVLESLGELLGADPVEEFGRYTRSFYTLEGHYENLWKYDRAILPKPDDPLLTQAIEYTRLQYKLPQKVRSLPWDDLKQVPFIPHSSAGWGYIGKKGAPGNHDKAIRRAVSSLYWWMETDPNRQPFRYRPDLAWTRTQLAKPDHPKIRHVWGEAFENVILEGITAAPLIEAYRAFSSPMIIGTHLYRRLPIIISQTLSDPLGNPQIGVGLDVSSFDSSVQPWLIRECFNIIEENIEFTGLMERASFEYTKHFFIRRPIVMPDGRMWLKKVGVPSGSYYTQLVDSIANSIVNAYAQLKVYGTTFPTYVLGDDSLFGVPRDLGFPDLDRFAEAFKSIGMTLSPDKCIVTQRADELQFLGHCARHTRLHRDSADLIRLALYPEFPVTGPAMSMTRIVGLLLDSTMTDWPILYLYRYMKIKYGRQFEEEDPSFDNDDKHWLMTVVGLTTRPKLLDELQCFTIT